jgi:autotransporter-associated beta strand protein
MNVRAVLILISLTAFAAAFRGVATPPAGYYEVWGDEFNGTSLDTTKWDYWLPGPRRDAVNVTNAVSVSGGYLTITTYTDNGTNYTAMVANDGKFRSRYGYWEASIKWGDTNGMWSAFWMQSPTMGTYLNDPVVSGSELDIVEHRSTDGGSNGDIINQVQNNIHWNGYGSAAKSAGSGNIGSGLGSGFHTYGFLWTPSVYTLYVDGSNLRSWNFANNGVPISESTEWTILSSEVDDTSTTWAGTIPSGGYGDLGTSTTELTVDYVRYYAPTNTIFWTGAGDATYLTNSANWVSNLPPLATSDLTFSMLSGNNLSPVLGGDLAVDGLVFLNLNNGASLNGTNTLTLGAGGIDMVAANHTININCPVNIGANQTWSVGPNSPGNTLNANGNISGLATLSKGGYGTVILNGTNNFSGTLNVDTGSTSANDGALRITRNQNIASVLSPISIRNNNSGSSTLQLDGTLGNLTIPQNLNLSGRNTNVVAIENLAGNNTLAGDLNLVVGGGNYWIQSDSGTLMLSGAVPASTPGGSRTLSFMGNANVSVTGPLQNGTGGGTVNVIQSGNGTLTLASTNNSLTGSLTVSNGTLQLGNGISDGTLGAATVMNNSAISLNIIGAITLPDAISGTGSLTENGAGTVALSGVNTYTGPTRVNAGTLLVNGSLGTSSVTVAGGILGGHGVVNGSVTVQSGGTLAPGVAGMDTLTFGGSLTLMAGSTNVMEINGAAQTNDVIRGVNLLAYGGTLIVTNLGSTLTVGDSFRLFYATNYSGDFAALNLPPLGTGLAWNTDGLTNGILSIVAVAPPQFGSITQTGDGNFLFSGTGSAGVTYELDAATNLALPVAWSFVTNTVADQSGQFQFADLQATNFAQRFYRITANQ